jgi:hypothetical protein
MVFDGSGKTTVTNFISPCPLQPFNRLIIVNLYRFLPGRSSVYHGQPIVKTAERLNWWLWLLPSLFVTTGDKK